MHTMSVTAPLSGIRSEGPAAVRVAPPLVAPIAAPADRAARGQSLHAAGLTLTVALAACFLFLLFVARPLAIGLSGSDDRSGRTAARIRYTVDTPFARQGVAVSAKALYAVSDHGIEALDRRTGRVIARISDDSRYHHLNSCIVRRTLVCAHSNFPALPMASSIETFDLATLRPVASHPLAEHRGSLTWIAPWGEGWLACFANYDGHGGAPGRDHTATLIEYLSPRLTVERIYRLPSAVLDRLAPHSASGGAVGRDGLLYVTGHDRPEAYVLAMPKRGDVLRHVATIPMPTDGQAIAFDPVAPLLLWSIDRDRRQLVASLVPSIDPRNGSAGRDESFHPQYDSRKGSKSRG